jgi:hypothetical protein
MPQVRHAEARSDGGHDGGLGASVKRELSKDLHAALWRVVYESRHLRRILDGDKDMTRETAEKNLCSALDGLDYVLNVEEPIE